MSGSIPHPIQRYVRVPVSEWKRTCPCGNRMYLVDSMWKGGKGRTAKPGELFVCWMCGKKEVVGPGGLPLGGSARQG